MEEEKCEHTYEAVKSIRQDIVKRYLTNGQYSITTLKQEVVTIFCIKCGKNIVIQESTCKVDEKN
jgi:hypothetical protein